ncbi:MAG: hypothetical protein A2W31_16440 [Planctomycetes bacterium RBG_16_64_10]|nr:MAG: hypothetical protein A2W31_16440 [Planctomycetes bacterium RBG_16_64_10]
MGAARDVLQACIENLTELTSRPELANDRLAQSSLPEAQRAWRRVVAPICSPGSLLSPRG